MIQIEQTLRLLIEHQVEFVIVGGVAVSAHGSSYLTYDLDVAYARTRDNLKRLAEALAPHHPRPRDFPADLPFVWDEQTLQQGTNFTLTTDLGNLDLLGEVSGLGDYEDVRDQSVVMNLFNLSCRVLSLDALIVAKRAAGRPKDLLVLPELEALREIAAKNK
ncbi:MAG: hypothetical protein QOG00_2047 [Pyrinomonadaceae bacterium]|jgi:hypothetical protein|nr:hypothetical protein [Pyrinomonadaceae bacterium]MDQ1612116.1 hypothetical protein [Pyrinomonadaceae bacterium]